MSAPPAAQRYWRANLRLLAILLSIWFAVAFLGGIVFADALDHIRVGGFGLGFWIAQQGSLLVFVILIVTYAVRMNRLDRQFDFHEDDDPPPPVNADGSDNHSTEQPR